MLLIRIAFALSLAIMLAGMIGAGAFAQTAVQPGKPLALLAGLTPPHQNAKPVTHLKTAAHKPARKVARKFALRRRHTVTASATAPSPPAEPMAESAAPAGGQPVPGNSQTAEISPAPSAALAPDSASEPAPPAQNPDAQNSDAALTNGQTVEIASPDYLNDIDRTAGRQDQAQGAAAMSSATADAAPVSTLTAAVAAQVDPAPIGSPSWMAQLLAALGGAITAGAVAWFLIGSGPVRTYG